MAGFGPVALRHFIFCTYARQSNPNGLESATTRTPMRIISLLMFFAAVLSLEAGPTNAILFVSQTAIPGDFTTIAATFGNQQATPERCGRGGDLHV